MFVRKQPDLGSTSSLCNFLEVLLHGWLLNCCVRLKRASGECSWCCKRLSVHHNMLVQLSPLLHFLSNATAVILDDPLIHPLPGHHTLKCNVSTTNT